MPPVDDEQRQVALADRYREVRALTEKLSDPLSPEDQTVQSMPDVSPTKWHRGHTSWFFETFCLQPFGKGYECCHPSYAYIFNSYYETVGARHPRAERGLISRPGVGEVAAYRRHVDHGVHRLLAEPVATEVLDLIELGLHHEQQHQELLLMDIKHVLSRNPLLPTYHCPGPPAAAETGATGWVEHGPGDVAVGHRAGGFAFDNETPAHRALVTPFALADRPVTCGEWRDFMEDGGYQRHELWLSDGWAAVQQQGWEAPLYWHRPDPDAGQPSGWRLFTLEGDRPVDPAEPVCHVSYYEADAFAHWTGHRLPTEFEWEAVAADRWPDIDQCPPELHPRPAGPGRGQVWEWTSSSYSPYPGYRAPVGAVGEYNGKFMVNQYVLRGGCCATPPGHARVTYRNFFPAAARWAFSGVRLARDL